MPLCQEIFCSGFIVFPIFDLGYPTFLLAIRQLYTLRIKADYEIIEINGNIVQNISKTEIFSMFETHILRIGMSVVPTIIIE
jgi:hypothetical protein